MKINMAGIEFQRSGLAKGVQPGSSEPKKSATQPAAPVQRGDSVQISDAGRALAAQRADAIRPTSGELTAERIGEIRQRILEGAYNSVDVVDQVARKMLERGDI